MYIFWRQNGQLSETKWTTIGDKIDNNSRQNGLLETKQANIKDKMDNFWRQI